MIWKSRQAKIAFSIRKCLHFDDMFLLIIYYFFINWNYENFYDLNQCLHKVLFNSDMNFLVQIRQINFTQLFLAYSIIKKQNWLPNTIDMFSNSMIILIISLRTNRDDVNLLFLNSSMDDNLVGWRILPICMFYNFLSFINHQKLLLFVEIIFEKSANDWFLTEMGDKGFVTHNITLTLIVDRDVP
jgi:hypothetical protein